MQNVIRKLQKVPNSKLGKRYRPSLSFINAIEHRITSVSVPLRSIIFVGAGLLGGNSLWKQCWTGKVCTPRVGCGRLAWEERSPALWTGLSTFLPYRAFFFGSAFFCAELFFLVGLFFLGSAVFFGIQLNFRLVNYLLIAAEYFFPFFHVVRSERQLHSQNISKQR